MERLRFGTTARRKALRQRVKFRLWVVSVIAMLLGVPGAQFGFDLVAKLGAQESGSGSQVRLSRGIETTETTASLLRFRRGMVRARTEPTPLPEAPPATPIAAPTPTPAVAAAPAGSVTEIIYSAAAEFGLSGSYLLSVASCESGLNPQAYNPAGYHGLFQFDQTTWAAYGYGSIFDPVAQSRTAAELLAAGHASRWPNCA
ncbi:MAG: transglycosylase family protein [Actinomycetota bacterium]|nr:transglycosylase family protein [Actinomycetota bacterium]